MSNSTDNDIFICDMARNLFLFPQAMVDGFNLPGQMIEDALPDKNLIDNVAQRVYQKTDDGGDGKIPRNCRATAAGDASITVASGLIQDYFKFYLRYTVKGYCMTPLLSCFVDKKSSYILSN